ncbi:hypothetical protein OAG19_00040 [Akkermansiaceae bacterium]|nr:hypothetical protein [Akkermansiaceae bacterium]
MQGDIFSAAENENFRELEAEPPVPRARGKDRRLDANPARDGARAWHYQWCNARQEPVLSPKRCDDHPVLSQFCSGHDAELEGKPIGPEARFRVAPNRGNQHDVVNRDRLLQVDLDPFFSGRAVMDVGPKADTSHATAETVAGQLLQLAIDFLHPVLELGQRQLGDRSTGDLRRDKEREQPDS